MARPIKRELSRIPVKPSLSVEEMAQKLADRADINMTHGSFAARLLRHPSYAIPPPECASGALYRFIYSSMVAGTGRGGGGATDHTRGGSEDVRRSQLRLLL